MLQSFRRAIGGLLSLSVTVTLTLPSATGAAASDAAHYQRQPALSLTDVGGLEGWRAAVADASWDEVSCRRIIELPGVMLCLYASSFAMTQALAWPNVVAERRSAFYAGRDQEEVDAPANLGYNLSVDDIAHYMAVATQWDGASKAERALHDFVQSDAEAPPLQAVLATAYGMRQTLVHELLHGAYVADLTFRRAVRTYWYGTLSEEERQGARRELSQWYDPDKPDLMVNEFQAYLLQPHETVLATLRSRHREALIDTLPPDQRRLVDLIAALDAQVSR